MRHALLGYLTLALALALAAGTAGCSGGPASAGDRSPSLEWERTYGGSGDEEIYAIAAAADGGVVLAGYSASSDGDLPGTRAGQDAWLLKLGPSGNPEWQTVLGGSMDDVAISVSQTADGGFVSAGFTWSGDGNFPAPEGARARPETPPESAMARPAPGRQGPRRAWAAKVDGTGRVQWARVYGLDGFYGISAIAPAADGGFIAVGDVLSNDAACRAEGPKPFSFDIWALRLDQLGEVLWLRCLGEPLNDLPLGAVASADGGAVLGATAWDRGRESGAPAGPGEGAWATALGPDGRTLWTREYAGAGAERAFSFRATPKGGYVIAGMKGSWGPGTDTQRVNAAVKTGVDGEVDWSSVPGGAGRLIDVLPSAGGYLAVLIPFTGDQGPSGAGSHPHDLVLARLGAGGAEEWRSGYGQAEGRPATAFTVAADGGLVAAGAVQKPRGPGESGDKDAWAMKLTP